MTTKFYGQNFKCLIILKSLSHSHKISFEMIRISFIIMTLTLRNSRSTTENICSTSTDCKTCISTKDLNGNICDWCVKDRRCYSPKERHDCANSSIITAQNACQELKRGEKRSYNPDEAYHNLLLSAAAYSDDPQTCLDSKYPKGGYKVINKAVADCEDFAFFKYKQCFAFTAVSTVTKKIVVAFRGTMLAGKPFQLLDEIFSVLYRGNVPFPTGGKVQNYFSKAQKNLYPCVKSSIMEIVKKYPFYEVVVTGHSLGGAIASLTAVTLVYKGIVHSENLTLYNFGSPRVGDQVFAEHFDRIVNNSFRVVHYRDVVPHLPICLIECGVDPDFPYHHKMEVFYPKKNMTVHSNYKVCSMDEDMSCSDGSLSKKWCVEDIVDCIHYHRYYFQLHVGTYCSSYRQNEKPFDLSGSTCKVFP